MANLNVKKVKQFAFTPPHPTLTAYHPIPGKGGRHTPSFKIKMTAKDVKEITCMT